VRSKIRRAAGRVVPFVADFVSAGGIESQRIAIAVKRAVERHAGIDAVVKSALYHIREIVVGFWNPTVPRKPRRNWSTCWPTEQEAAGEELEGARRDADFRAAFAATEKDGKLVDKVESVYLNPADYSPMQVAAARTTGHCPVSLPRKEGQSRARSVGEVHRLLSEGDGHGLCKWLNQFARSQPQETPPRPMQARRRERPARWSGLEALLFNDMPDAEIERPPLTHHELVLFNRPPDVFVSGLRGGKAEPAAHPRGTVAVVPAGTPSRRQWRGHMGSLLVFLEPDLVTRGRRRAVRPGPGAVVAVPPLDFLDRPQLRAAMLAVEAELTAGGLAGRSPPSPWPTSWPST